MLNLYIITISYSSQRKTSFLKKIKQILRLLVIFPQLIVMQH